MARKREADIASRIAVLLGEKPRERMKLKSFTDEELEGFLGNDITDAQRNDLKKRIKPFIKRRPSSRWDKEALSKTLGCAKFQRDVFLTEFQDFQLAMVYLMLAHKDTAFVLGRQIGKDYTVAGFVPWECITVPNTKALIISEGQRASNLLRDRAYANIARHKASYYCVRKSKVDECIFKNGSSLYPLPSKGAIRGFTEVTRVIANEAAYIPDVCFDAFEPMLARHGGSLNLFSTPLGTAGKLYRYFTDESFAVMQLPSRENQYLLTDFFEKQKRHMSSSSYMREYEAVFSDAENLFFNPDIIDECVEDYEPQDGPRGDHYYYAGYDPARTRNSSVVVVISKSPAGKHRVEQIKNFHDRGFHDVQLPYVAHLHKKFNFVKMCPEYAGLGIGPTEALELSGFPVERFVPSGERKAQGYDYLKSLMEKGLLSIETSHHNLISELKLLQFKISELGNMMIHHEEGGSDDYADALMLACYAAKTGAVLTDLPALAGRYDKRGKL